MKQKLLFLLVLLLTATTGAWAQTQWTSGSCTVTLSNGTLTFSGKGAMDDYQTPNNRPWNFNTNDVTSVVVESGVTTVGAMSFCNFGKMTSVTLPEGLTSIGTRSFLSCSKLTSVTIPSTVTSIGADAFYSCTSVTDVNLYADPANLTWNEDGCDDFNRDVMGSTKCHVLAEYLSAYETKFSEKINVTFVGDLKPLTPTTYSVTLAEGTEDADKWTVKVGEGEAQTFPVEGLEGGEKITVTYGGEKKVKSVKAVKVAPAATDLATITADYGAKDGETLTGTLANNVKISIADGATVTLKDVNITNLGNDCNWAGISCPGDATLVLEGTNTVCAGRGDDGYNNYPGIWIAPDKTLTIQGDGTLTAYSNDSQPYGAGIGGGYGIACGNIVINSGTITATGGAFAAGIGSGNNSGSCGNITINGGTITATGGNFAAGIGSGNNSGSCGTITISGGTVEATGGNSGAGIGGGNKNGVCGTITITSGVTSVKATKGTNAPNSIGKGEGGQDITVNIENGANVIMAPVTVTWNSVNFDGIPYTKDGVTLTPSNDRAAMGDNFYDYGNNTFTTTLGKFTKIEIVCKFPDDINGWTQEIVGSYQPYPEEPDYFENIYKMTWTGNAESVIIQGKNVSGMQSITFTIQ